MLFNEKQGISSLIVLAAVLMVIHFINCINFKYVLEWKRDADIPEIISDLDIFRNKYYQDKEKISCGVNLEFEQPLNYYIRKDSIRWLEKTDRKNKFNPEMDFYLYDSSDVSKSLDNSFIALKTYPVSGAELFLNNR